ncbi:class I SAM-dependent methyltransferase [Jannaschia pohangensis]|uniref:16S rRNA m(2)G 1207 methyltransferase n=1 Tax=Jannaschia pohangensis TaxID=390807 RepID=A0A1I3NBP4_9RHOB|nr:methyltransferase [Jannaschia pohangensis]SFJ06300.1 16S rRNA m(2)G 1207 methyltransferase [Jannaschia pohangensis]
MNARLSLALAATAVTLPEGHILLLRPPADLVLEGLPLDRCVAVQGFRPDHDALAARGVAMPDAPEGPFAAVVVFAARAKALTLDLIAQACGAVAPGAPVIVDGSKGDGIDSVLKHCKASFDVEGVFAKAHGKVFSFTADTPPAAWLAASKTVDGFVTRPGVFSADGIDPGSALLARHLGDLSGKVCDLGAGWGFLAKAALAAGKVTECTLVEAERDALECARVNITDSRARFHWADATRFEGGPFDVVISNPPFHVARKADPDIGRAFLEAAARLLSPRGRFLMVANRHLPYEATLDEVFGQTVALTEQGGYKIIEAQKPRKVPVRATAPKRRRP